MHNLEPASLQRLLSTKHNAIFDYSYQVTLKNAPWSEWLSTPGFFDVAEEYKQVIIKWISENTVNTINGTENFSKIDIISGTTQGFDEAFYRYRNKRLRLFRGEYGYHRRVISDAVWIDSVSNELAEPIQKNDWIIVSVPFCGNGKYPPNMAEVLDMAYVNKVPVVLDCAWYGTCYGITLPLAHPAITEVLFSISKSTGTGRIRSGVRLSNYQDNLPIRQQNNYNHLILGAAQIGIWMMNHFRSDWQPIKYKEAQHLLCSTMDISPTPSLHIALADGSKDWHKKFLIDEKYYKIGIRDAVKLVYNYKFKVK